MYEFLFSSYRKPVVDLLVKIIYGIIQYIFILVTDIL